MSLASEVLPSRVIAAEELVAVRLVVAGIDRGADLVHQAHHELEVVQGAQGSCEEFFRAQQVVDIGCLLYTSPSPRDATLSRMPSSA